MPASSRRLDLLLVADNLQGGLGAAVTAQARWFADHGWQVGVAAPEWDGESDVPGVERVALPVPLSAFQGIAMARAARRLRAVFRGGRPRIVHAHGTRAQVLVLLAGRRPCVTMHGAGRIAGQTGVGTLLRLAGRRVAPRLARRAYSAWPAGPGWTTLLHASPRLRSLSPAPVERMASVPTFLWLGRLDPPKQPELFVRACAALASQREVRGVVVGTGEHLEDVRRLVASLSAPVDVLGHVEDVSDQIAGAWAVCLFSGFEAASFAIQEAMWAARPVVVSPLPGLQWLAGVEARYVVDLDTATAALSELCERTVAEAAGVASATRARSVLRADAPFPQLLADYRVLDRTDS